MLSIAHIRANREAVIEALNKRHIQAETLIDEAIRIDEERRTTQAELDKNLQEAKQIAAKIGQLFKEGKTEEANAAKAETGTLKTTNQNLDAQLKSLEKALVETLSSIPNTPHATVVSGKSSEDNETIRSFG